MDNGKILLCFKLIYLDARIEIEVLRIIDPASQNYISAGFSLTQKGIENLCQSEVDRRGRVHVGKGGRFLVCNKTHCRLISPSAQRLTEDIRPSPLKGNYCIRQLWQRHVCDPPSACTRTRGSQQECLETLISVWILSTYATRGTHRCWTIHAYIPGHKDEHFRKFGFCSLTAS